MHLLLRYRIADMTGEGFFHPCKFQDIQAKCLAVALRGHFVKDLYPGRTFAEYRPSQILPLAYVQWFSLQVYDTGQPMSIQRHRRLSLRFAAGESPLDKPDARGRNVDRPGKCRPIPPCLALQKGPCRRFPIILTLRDFQNLAR
jgi:hypothetical protein